jgi:hypothetical protein
MEGKGLTYRTSAERSAVAEISAPWPDASGGEQRATPAFGCYLLLCRDLSFELPHPQQVEYPLGHASNPLRERKWLI